MGYSRIVPTYIRKTSSSEFVCQWNTKVFGKPNAANLEKWRMAFNASLRKGGANEHIGAKGHLLCRLEIYSHKKGVLAQINPPAFEII